MGFNYLSFKVKRMLHICVCPNSCDCEHPPTHISNLCPVHNEIPYPNPDCTAKVHRNGAKTW